MPAQNEKKIIFRVLGRLVPHVIAITVLTAAYHPVQAGLSVSSRIRATVGAMHAVGTAFLIVGIWVSAAIKEKLREKIYVNQLVTTGVYAAGQKPPSTRICVCQGQCTVSYTTTPWAI